MNSMIPDLEIIIDIICLIIYLSVYGTEYDTYTLSYFI